MEIRVFVSYAWEDENHNSKVLSFSNKLRTDGFHAHVDAYLSQQQTALDFTKMMHQAMTDYGKVIIVLSKKYKEKAQQFKGGVGTEYLLINKDIENNPNKYILVSFEGRSDDIIPLAFKGREIIDLNEGSQAFERLYAKLLDKPSYLFEEVGVRLPQVQPKKIPSWPVAAPALEEPQITTWKITESARFFQFATLHFEELNVYELINPIKLITRQVVFYFNNISGNTIDGCRIEIKQGGEFIDNPKGVSYPIKSIANKILPGSRVATDPLDITVTSKNSALAEKAAIKIIIHSDLGAYECTIPVFECISIRFNGIRRNVDVFDFAQ